MITVYSEDHRLHNPKDELHRGRLIPCAERPQRAEVIIERVRESRLGDVISPQAHGLEPIRRVHSDRYIDFLRSAYDVWSAEYGEIDALPGGFPSRADHFGEPSGIAGRLGYYGFDTSTPITAGTWKAINAAVDVALTAQELVAGGAAAAFALTRPPGHHASRELFGGYGFFNNAAAAAEAFRTGRAQRVAVLDVDFHHGNGTQALFYDRSDVLYVSLHADPNHAYPFFFGYTDQIGQADGEGYNLNLPLPAGTDWAGYQPAFQTGLARIRDFGADVLVVSLGVDTYEGDPISGFLLKTEDFPRIGQAIGELHLPTLFVMEGGYAVKEVGINVVNLLTGFES